MAYGGGLERFGLGSNLQPAFVVHVILLVVGGLWQLRGSSGSSGLRVFGSSFLLVLSC